VRRDFRASPLLGAYFFILFPSLLQVAAAPRPHRATHRLQRDAAQLERLWLRRAPLGIPDVEARDVKLKRLLVAERRSDALHHQLLLRDGHVANVARLAVGWTTPESRHAVIRQATVLKFLADDETNLVSFH